MQSEQSVSWAPVHIFGEEREAKWLIVCDHAVNTVPSWLNGGTLGLPDGDMARHIAYDIGVAGVALRLAERLGATVVMANFSRLVIDPNRGKDDPTLVRRLYDETIIPANRCIDSFEIEQRLARCYRPYHAEIKRLADRRADTVVISVHSFSPQLRHRQKRPWHIGLLFADDSRLSLPLIDLLRAEEGLVVGENEPYPGYLAGDTIEQHATLKGRQNTLIEIRNDLIADDDGQSNWAERLARLLPMALQAAENQRA